MTSELKILLLVFFFVFLVDDLFKTIGSENYKVGYQHLNTYKFRNRFLNYSPCDFNNILTNLTRTIPDLFTKLPFLRTFYRQARIQDFMLISIETHLTCDFPEGSGHLSPPLDPHMTHLCTKMRSTENNVCVILIGAFLGIDQRQLCRFVSLSYMVCLFSYASDGKNRS